VSTTLPTPLTRFIGREAELNRAAALLADARLLTLTGPGGAGKTRLALQLASAVADQFADGVWFVDFSPLPDGQFVWDRVAITLGVKEPGLGRTLAEAVGRHLAPSQALVLLDNCEHLVAPAAEVAAALLTAAPALKIIATSREPLAVPGEVSWALPSLSEPDAIELFSDRARQVRPEFRLRDADADSVRTICRRLDGLPLAIELAAARARALDPAYIATGLKDHLRLLPSGPRTAPLRQSTLAASFEWSHELLSDAERALLRQLSVFAGGFDVEAALAVCPAASLELLAALTDRSMIMVDRRDDLAAPRYRMLETVREFAAEHLDEASEVFLMRSRHRNYYLAMAEAAEPKLRGPEQDYWLARLRGEQDNLRSALAWNQKQGEPDALARMVVALMGFWAIAGRWIEAQMWLDTASGYAADVSPRLRARIRNWECMRAFSGRRSLGEVPALANEALALARAAGDNREEANALFNLGFVAGLIGGAQAMRPYIDEALPLARKAGYAQQTLVGLGAYVFLRLFQSDPEETYRLAEDAIAIAKAGGDRHFVLWASWMAGLTAVFQGRLLEAARRLEGVVADGRLSNDNAVMPGLLGLGFVSMFCGDFAAARAEVSESLAAARESEAESGTLRVEDAAANWILGWMALAAGDAAQARESLTAAVNAFRSTPVQRWAALPLLGVAEANVGLGALDEAAANLDEATSLAHSGALTWVLGRASLIRAKLRARQGDLQEAERLAHEALNLGREAGDQLGLVDALEVLARLAAAQDSHKEGVRLWAAAQAMRDKLGYRFTTDRAANDAWLAQAKDALGADDFAVARAAGAKLSINDAIAYVARGRGERRRPTTGWASLTPSELEVARLVGQHCSNPEIAARLFVSRATVKTHLVHIFAKLGMDSRSELAAEAIKRGVERQPNQPK
jgi:predicted ATPase/DNA-binding CsgD family transcriptional regulator